MIKVLDLFCGAGGAAMGIDWMTVKEISESVPPAYSKYLVEQIRFT